MSTVPRNTILVGDAHDRLQQLPLGSVDCVITSPPYFQLRDYGASGQLGLEPTVQAWVEDLRMVMAEVARVLRPTGSLWLNLGDSYSRHERYGTGAKGLLLAPERLLLSLVADGWVCRNKVIWAKTNPMPSSVGDRLNTTYEPVYFLVRSRRYFFDLDAIRQPHRSRSGRRSGSAPGEVPAWAGPLAGKQDGLRRPRSAGRPGHALGKNPGDVWTIATAGFRGAHFATFPEALVERPLLATCPERVCVKCGQGWRRQRQPGRVGRLIPCLCQAGTRPGVVLDPFLGSGTVGVLAARQHRDWIGIELNPDFVALAQERLSRARGARYHRESTGYGEPELRPRSFVDVVRLQEVIATA